MADDGVQWKGLLKWSLAQTDGTGTARNLSEEDQRWFREAMQAQTVDVVKRMKEITLVMRTPDDVLQAQGVTSSDLEGMLDELQEHVESIDMANDLHSIGGLVPLIGYLKNSNAGIRAKAAEVVTTIVQNNPRSQQLVMEANAMEPLLSSFTSDPDITVRTKALGAISSLIRHNKPGLAAFRLANGLAGLRDALGSENVRFQRKALNMIQYLLHESESDRAAAVDLGLRRQMLHLAASEDPDTREAALHCLLELNMVAPPPPDEDKKRLRQVLESRAQSISKMGPDDLNAAREERHLVDAIWSECFDEPSYLRRMGLVVLPGEDGPLPPPPDVARQLLEPPLRALADGGRQTAPLLLHDRPSQI